MNLVDKYLIECVANRNYNWCTQNLYINVDQPFLPTSGQEEILLTRDNVKAFLMPRGSGASTIIAMDAITEASLNPMSEVMIFVQNQLAVSQMLKRIKDILNYSSIETLKTSLRTNRDHILLDNQSIIKIVTPNPACYVGYRPNAMYIDNFDMINSEDLSNIFNRLMYRTNKVLIIGNNVNSYEATQRIVNINQNQI